MTISADPHAAAEARRALRRVVDQSSMTPECFADLELLVSELVTNAVTHTASDAVELRVRLGPVVRVCVIDNGEGELEVSAPAIGGWGLRLVDTLAVEWGVVPLPTGKAVWFDLETNGHEVVTTDP